MLEEFKNFHKRLKCTMIYVTHDQKEAMTLSDKIAVMDKGIILQYASPIKINNKPNSKKVATFVGNGIVLEKEMSYM
ncbi:ABC transporter component [Caminibacter mediatlanticus TB-2]|uniref:ABC transporter component n=2 Tax=Caminibacter mediatlanticus TaxID=291048 RepID=A0AAI9AG54_9BACT|nr:ABC transporter component [Caminibacter mediatlanticus TB-2]